MNREVTGRRLADRITELLGTPLPGAACTSVDPDLWYPEKGDSTGSKVAKTICRGGTIHGKRVPPCPVRAQCLARARDFSGEVTHYGTWAGYTAQTLGRMRRPRSALRAACPPAEAKDVAA